MEEFEALQSDTFYVKNICEITKYFKPFRKVIAGLISVFFFQKMVFLITFRIMFAISIYHIQASNGSLGK